MHPCNVRRAGRLAGTRQRQNFSDTSSLDSERVEQSASFEFEVIASSEEDAREKGDDALNDLRFYSNDSSFEWEIEDIEIHDVTRTSAEPTLAEAVEIVRDWVEGHLDSDEDGDVKEAFGIVLDSGVETLREQVRLLAAKLETPFELRDRPGEAGRGDQPGVPGDRGRPRHRRLVVAAPSSPSGAAPRSNPTERRSSGLRPRKGRASRP